jgi:zinc/manganese transport system substrate-binding protein
MRSALRFLTLSLLAIAASAAPAAAQTLRVVTTTADLGSLAQEVGGDKVTVVSLAKGYQDPHFVDPKPSFILEVSRANLLIAIGRELEIGWLPPLINNSRNAKVQPGSAGYLDASANVKILEIPTDKSRARWATCILPAIPITGWSLTTAAGSPPRFATR